MALERLIDGSLIDGVAPRWSSLFLTRAESSKPSKNPTGRVPITKKGQKIALFFVFLMTPADANSHFKQLVKKRCKSANQLGLLWSSGSSLFPTLMSVPVNRVWAFIL